METAAAILQVAEMAGKTAFQIHEAISIIRDAPREIQTINRDVHSFYILVHNLSESLSSDLVSNIVNEDTEISNALWTLNDPILNCCAALDRLMKKIKPHLKTDESSSQPEDESSETVQRTRISRSDIMWYFRRKGVYNLANDLERTKSTFESAMGSITLLLTLRMPGLVPENGYHQRNYEFNDDAGSALTRYAAVRASEPSDGDTTLTPRHSVVSLETQTTAPEKVMRSDLEAAHELLKVISEGSIFLVNAVLGHVHPDARDEVGRTALSHAADKGKLEVSKTLIAHGASVSARQWSVTSWTGGRNPVAESGATPLYYAIRGGHLEIVKLLLQHGANPGARPTAGMTPLILASELGFVEIVKLLLAKNVDVNARTFKDGWAPLHGATTKGHLEIANILLDHGAFPNIPQTSAEGVTPLHHAVTHGRLNFMRVYLKRGADPNVVQLENITPLHLAATRGWVAAIELLVSSDALIDARDALLHESPLHKAARNRETAAIQKLCELGANQQAKNVDGQTYQDILECAMARPNDWKVPLHLGIYISKDLWWVGAN